MRSHSKGARNGRIAVYRTEVQGVLSCNGRAYLEGKSKKPGEIVLLPRTRWNLLKIWAKVRFHFLKNKFYARHSK
jgi:hypothetical protein